MTVCLFWFLRTLIGVSVNLGEFQTTPKIDFVRLRHDTEIEEKKRAKPEIDKPEAPPTTPTVVTSSTLSVDPGLDIAALAPSVDVSGVGTGGGIGGLAGTPGVGAGTDRDAVPQVRILPEYPEQAQRKRIEGWVEVEFTVAMDGSVKNPVVRAAHPGTIFNRAAIKAITGWKYSPRIVDGRPVERPGVTVRLAFELED